MYRIIQATTRPLFMYIRQFSALSSDTVSWKRERVSSSHDLHPSSLLHARASNHRTGINAYEAEKKGNRLRVLRPAEYEGAANENGNLVFRDCEMQDKYA